MNQVNITLKDNQPYYFFITTNRILSMCQKIVCNNIMTRLIKQDYWICIRFKVYKYFWSIVWGHLKLRTWPWLQPWKSGLHCKKKRWQKNSWKCSVSSSMKIWHWQSETQAAALPFALAERYQFRAMSKARVQWIGQAQSCGQTTFIWQACLLVSCFNWKSKGRKRDGETGVACVTHYVLFVRVRGQELLIGKLL